MKLAVKAGIIVGALILQIGLAILLVNWMAGKDPAGADGGHGAADSLAASDSVEHGAGGKEKGKEKAYEYGAVHAIPDLIINPRGSQGRRVFKISLSLEYDPNNPELAKELAERSPFMRDYLINTLGSMTEDSLSDISYREAIRDSLGTALNRFLSAGKVDRVLFQDFIRQ